MGFACFQAHREDDGPVDAEKVKTDAKVITLP